MTTLFGRIRRFSARLILLVGNTDSKKTERVYRLPICPVLELGGDFTFVGRQRRLRVGDTRPF
jgi:hypothetical protein